MIIDAGPRVNDQSDAGFVEAMIFTSRLDSEQRAEIEGQAPTWLCARMPAGPWRAGRHYASLKLPPRDDTEFDGRVVHGGRDMMLTISIAMATYNGGRYLREQLDSIGRQTLAPAELVISDDGSSDETAAIVATFAATANFPVRYEVNPKRLGYNGNFARAIDRCSGEVIALCDQDDKWHDDKLQTVSERLAASPGLLCVTNNQEIVDADGASTGATVLGNVRRLGHHDRAFGPGCCTTFRRELLDVVAPFPADRVPYDHWITLLADILGVRAIEERSLQLYRRHDSNASGSVFAHPRPSARTLIGIARMTDPRDSFATKVAETDTFLQRLDDRAEVVSRWGLDDARRIAVTQLRSERRDYQMRLAGLQLRRLPRAWAIAKMVRNGHYARFHGWKTAAKDFLS